MPIPVFKSILYPFAALFLPLAIFLILLQAGFGKLYYPDHLWHIGVMALIFFLASYVVYSAFSFFKSSGNRTAYFIALAFACYAGSFLMHVVSTPEWLFPETQIFDISEHFGLFFGTLLLFIGTTFPPHYRYLDNLIDRYGALVLGIFIFLQFSALFFIPLSSEMVVRNIETIVNFAVILTGVLVLLLLVSLWNKYRENGDKLLFWMIIGFAILFSSAVIPLFYEEWNIIWWFFHLVVLIGFSFIFYGLSRVSYRDRYGLEIFSGTPLHSRMLTRLLVIFVLVLSIGPLGIVGYLASGSFTRGIEEQIMDHINMLAESKEGHVFDFLERIRGRAADFSSDGQIRELTAELADQPDNLALRRELSRYITEYKYPLSEILYGINIVNERGIVVASTDASEIGKDESDDDYFKNTISLNYGEAQVNDVDISHHFAEESHTITASAPIFDPEIKRRVGIIVNYYNTSELDDILLGRQQIKLGAFSGARGFPEKIDIYLVNKDGLIISESRYLGAGAFMKKFASLEPVEGCRAGKETYGEWTSYLGQTVFGSAMCFVRHDWTLIVEFDKESALAPIAALQRSLATIIFGVVFFVALLGFYFSRRLSLPIESLIGTMRRVARGEFVARAIITTKDEIGELGRSFNGMLDQLSESTRVIGLERKKLEIILNSLPVPVAIVNDRREIQYTNRLFQKIFGGNCIGDECKTMLIDNKQICPNCPLARGLVGMASAGIVEVDGVVGGRIYSVLHAPFEDVSGKMFVIEIYRDVTREREIDRAKNEFVSVASHQLRTPLTAVNWYAEMLLSSDIGPLTPKQKSYLQEIFNGSRRMGYLINDLLNLSRIESGRLKIEPRLIELDILLQQILDNFRPVAVERKCHIVFKKANMQFPTIRVDPTLFGQVLINLLSNAVNYSKEGECSVIMELSLTGRTAMVEARSENASNVLIVVRDSGIGIPPADRSHIFEKFFRAPNAVKRVTEGTGLGLYIAKLIIESFGGKIWFETEENVGTSFFITIPIAGSKKNG